jgi:hypothetical protein
MPLLKPPEPVITQRRYYLRIEDSLAQTMQRYAEFMGSDNLDQLTSFSLMRNGTQGFSSFVTRAGRMCGPSSWRSKG